MRPSVGDRFKHPFPGTRAKVGRKPTTPHRSAGPMMEPVLSVPIAKAQKPAAVAEPRPALDPLDDSSRFQGFLVSPPNQAEPRANSPVTALPRRTAPAFLSIVTTAASSAGTR